jgi:2,4-dienoyl-CoA reductase (NADPH2)
MKMFEPITIRNMQFKNRFMMAAMAIGPLSLGNENKKQHVINYYAERAKGGVAAIIMGGVVINYLNPDEELGQNIPPVRFIEAMKQLVEEVHKNGAKFGVQIWHTHQYPSGAWGRPTSPQEWAAPSPRTEHELHYMPPGTEMRAFTIREIEMIISRFARAAAQVKKTGADFVELHLAHGHMPNQFFSPVFNQRQDRYGGDLAGRMRFGVECVRAIRSSVGQNYPIFVRLGAVDENPKGITLADSTAFAIELQKAGTDCLDVSVASNSKHSYINYQAPLKKRPMGIFVPFAETIKKSVNIPVAAVGRLHDPVLAENVIATGKADIIAIGRQLIADPHWVRKIAEGRETKICACTSCNTWCFLVGSQGLRPSHLCRISRRPGEETELLRRF